MKSLMGHIAVHKATNEQGLILEEININNTGWKAQFSLDNKIQIDRINLTDLEIGSIRSDSEILDRLLRDITATNNETREWAAEMLCNFIEQAGADLQIDELQTAINTMVHKIADEDNWNIGQMLGEGIYEFICLQKIDKKDELALVKELALLGKDFLYSCLDDEEYLQIKEVNDFINDKSKWWNTSS